VIPDGHVLDDELVRRVASRIWVWVLSDRHEGMMLGAKMRGWIAERLELEAAAE
jgi:hypothetical protein